ILPTIASSSDTLYAATIGTPAIANSSVDVPDFVKAARAVRNASCFSSGSAVTRAGMGHVATAARTASTSRGTAGTTASNGPYCFATWAIAEPNTGAMRRISPVRLPGKPEPEEDPRAATALQAHLASDQPAV